MGTFPSTNYTLMSLYQSLNIYSAYTISIKDNKSQSMHKIFQ